MSETGKEITKNRTDGAVYSNEKQNIQLTLVRPSNNMQNEIDLFAIAVWLKRLFTLWLALAVALGGISTGVGLLLQRVTYLGDASALVTFSEGAKESGLDNDAGISLISSAQVVSEAMRACGIDLRRVDSIRTNIKVASFMTDEANDRRTLYSTLLTKSSNSLEVADALLQSGKETAGYVVSLDYRNAGLSREQGILLLDAVLNSYRGYVESNYNFNEVIGSPTLVLDYHEYDYSETVEIFSDTLDRIDSYLEKVEASDRMSFRSQKTGYTFAELQEVVSLVREVELDQANAYIVLNSVTANGGDMEIARYEWLIRELERKKVVEQNTLDALTASIDAYEKDPVVYALESTVINSDKDYYDRLITDKLASRETISGYDRTIRYYQMLIKGYRGSGVSVQEKRDQADLYLATLNDKVNRLITDIRETAEDYYSKANVTSTVNIWVPAIAAAPKLTGHSVVVCLGMTEGVLLLLYLGAACIYGIRDSGPAADKKKEVPEQEKCGT